MSGLTGFDISGGIDLSYIFQPHISGSTNTTGFKSYGIDLSNIFQPFVKGKSIKIPDTGFEFSGNDLSNIFEGKIYTTYDISNILITTYNNHGYTGLVFDISGYQTINEKPNGTTIPVPNAYAKINFNIDLSVNLIIIGAGGGGAGSFGGNSGGADMYGGGGGGGGTIYLSNLNLTSGTYNINVGFGIKNNGNPSPIVEGGNSSLESTDVSFIAHSGGSGYIGKDAFLSYGGAGGGTNKSSAINKYGGGGGGGGKGFYCNRNSNGGSNIDNLNKGIDGIINNGGGSFIYGYNIPFTDISLNITAGGGGGTCGQIPNGNGINDGNNNYAGIAGNGKGGTEFRYNHFQGASANNSFVNQYSPFVPYFYPPGYGGGGGGGSGNGSGGIISSGGAGGNGVVIIYWLNDQ